MRDVNAFRERFNYWKSTGELPYEAGLPKYDRGKNGGNIYDRFAALLGPYVYKYMSQSGLKDLDRAYMYAMKLLAYESDYGRSRVARQQHNYGGYGWNGKTYTTFKNDDDFARAYSKLITSRYRKALESDTIHGYAEGLKEKGYYEDSVENYSRNLAGMKAIERAVLNHRKNNASLYTNSPATKSAGVIETVPTAIEVVEATPKWDYPEIKAPTFGTNRPYYDPTTPQSVSRANASYGEGYSFVPTFSINGMLDILNQNDLQLLPKRFITTE